MKESLLDPDQYRILVENTSDILYVADSDLTVAYISPQVQQYGFVPTDFRKRRLSQFVDPRDREEFKRCFQRLLCGEANGRIHFRMRDKRGDEHWFEDRSRPQRDSSGKIVGVVGALRDITFGKRAERELMAKEQFLQRVLDQTLEAIVLLRLDGTVVHINEVALKLGEIETRDAIDNPLWKLSPWSLLPEIRARIRRSIRHAAQGHVAHLEMDFPPGRTAVTAVDFSLKPLRDAEGRLDLLVAEARDITDRRRLERELFDVSIRERRRIGQDLHDVLGQKLTGLAFLSKVLEEQLREKSLSEAKDAKAIEGLASESLDVTRSLAKGICPLAIEKDALPDALEELAEDISETYGIRCVFRCPQAIEVSQDRVATNLYEIASEAVTNALKHAEADSIRITLRQARERLTLSVRDDGQGVPKASDGLKGIGLRVMRYRASSIGGTLDVRPLPKEGTLVLCTVPNLSVP